MFCFGFFLPITTLRAESLYIHDDIIVHHECPWTRERKVSLLPLKMTSLVMQDKFPNIRRCFSESKIVG